MASRLVLVLRFASAFALAAALTVPARAAPGVADTSAAARAEGRPRGAIFEFGQPRREPAALDTIPHPWPGVATALTAAGIVGPAFLIGTALGPETDDGMLAAGIVLMVIGPASGHLYGGVPERAVPGLVVRSLGTGLLLGSVVAAGGSHPFRDGGPSTEFVVAGGLLLGGVLIASSAISDFAHVDGDVRRANLRRAGLSLRAAPGTGAPALALTLRR